MKTALLFGLLITAAVQDLKSGKISNRLIVTGLMIGVAIQVTEYRVWGVYYFLRNISVPVILLYLLFQMHVLGAGDIKLFSMIGSILTTGELLQCMAYSFLTAGAHEKCGGAKAVSAGFKLPKDFSGIHGRHGQMAEAYTGTHGGRTDEQAVGLLR